MAKHKEVKNSIKDSGHKETSTTRNCYSNSVANNVKTQKSLSSDGRERRDGPGGN